MGFYVHLPKAGCKIERGTKTEKTHKFYYKTCALIKTITLSLIVNKKGRGN